MSPKLHRPCGTTTAQWTRRPLRSITAQRRSILLRGDIEQWLGYDGALLSGEFDIPLVIQDRLFNPDRSLFFDPFKHNGHLGNVFVVNGKAQPYFHVC